MQQICQKSRIRLFVSAGQQPAGQPTERSSREERENTQTILGADRGEVHANGGYLYSSSASKGWGSV